MRSTQLVLCNLCIEISNEKSFILNRLYGDYTYGSSNDLGEIGADGFCNFRIRNVEGTKWM